MMIGGFIMVFSIPAIILFNIGWFIKYKKVTWLISGYNTASNEEKQKYDIEKLSKHMSNFLFVLAGITLVMAIMSFVFSEYSELITWIGFGVLAITIVGGIIYLNTGNRVKKVLK